MSKTDTNNRIILLLGSIPIEGIPSSYGGATVLMSSLKKYVQKYKVSHNFIQLNRPLGRFSSAKNFFSTLLKTLKNLKKSDIIFLNASSNGAFYLSPILYLLTKLYKKKFILRLFGSNFSEVYKSQKGLFRYLFRKTSLRSDLIIVETKINKDFFESFQAKDIYWLPNVRSRQKITKKKDDFRKRFVFISHVKESKGVIELIKASDALDNSYTVDVYGPVFDDFDLEVFKTSKAKYKGTLKPNEVINTLLLYDVLVLPTYYKEEGYPGIVIEAMSLGIPSISTQWNSIPEIVEDQKNGILIPIKDQVALQKAIEFYNSENYKDFVINTLEKFLDFDEVKVYEKLLLKLEKLKS